MIQVLIIVLAFLLANVPWMSNRLWFVVPLSASTKSLTWVLVELVTLYFMMGALGYLAEIKTMGQTVPQHWEFYATTACLFLVFTFPGFVYKVLWKKS